MRSPSGRWTTRWYWDCLFCLPSRATMRADADSRQRGLRGAELPDRHGRQGGRGRPRSVVRLRRHCAGAGERGPAGDGQLTVGSAIASAVAIVEKENPPGLETLTWVQRVEVMEERGTDQPFDFPAAELTVTKQGEVLNDRAVS